MSSAIMRRCRSVGVGHGMAVDVDDHVAGADAGTVGRTGCDDVRDTDRTVGAGQATQRRRNGVRGSGDAHVGPADPAGGNQLGDNQAGGVVDRNGEAKPDAGDGGVDADHLPRAVDERPAGVAGVERGVGLDDVVDDQVAGRSLPAATGPSADTTPAVTATRSRCGLPMATTSWPTRRRGVAQDSVGQKPICVDLDDGEVGPRIDPDGAEADISPVTQHRPTTAAPPTTCAFVTRNPSAVKTTAEPPPPSRPSSAGIRRLATDGPTRSATSMTAHE